MSIIYCVTHGSYTRIFENVKEEREDYYNKKLECIEIDGIGFSVWRGTSSNMSWLKTQHPVEVHGEASLLCFVQNPYFFYSGLPVMQFNPENPRQWSIQQDYSIIYKVPHFAQNTWEDKIQRKRCEPLNKDFKTKTGLALQSYMSFRKNNNILDVALLDGAILEDEKSEKVCYEPI